MAFLGKTKSGQLNHLHRVVFLQNPVLLETGQLMLRDVHNQLVLMEDFNPLARDFLS